MFWKISKKVGSGLIIILLIGCLIPQNLTMPVENATAADYHQNSFWYYPWGRSVTHKGMDIFAKKGTTINSATQGLVLYAGNIRKGGNVVLILGPKWRLHYYAHLHKTAVSNFSVMHQDTKIGLVGTSGNAKGKPSHLHYAIVTIFHTFGEWMRIGRVGRRCFI